MIVCEDEGGLVFYRPGDIASMVMEMPLRCRIVSRDGNVSFRTDWPEGNWAQLGEARVNPNWLTKLGKNLWSDPAGFVLVGALGEVAPMTVSGSTSVVLGIPMDEVVGVWSDDGLRSIWVTDRGEIAQEGSAKSLAEAYPELVQLQRGVYLNLQRLRRLQARPNCMTLDVVLTDGQVFRSIERGTASKFAARLGLPSAFRVEPPVPGLDGDFLRDWPFEIATASAEVLKRHFPSARRLIAHILYQTFRHHHLGIKHRYGKTHRGFWYRPLHSALYRAGFLSNRRARWVEPGAEARSTDEELCLRYYRILETMVGEQRLIHFMGLGFKEVRMGARRMGRKRPEVLLVAEKESISDYGLAVHRKLGISYVETGGYPKLIASEFLAKRWLEAGIAEVEVVAFVDLDPDGWGLVDTLEAQLLRYGMRLRRPPCFVITGDQLSPDEVENLTLPCEHPEGEKVQKWLARGGGIGGRPLHFYANHFEPLERVLARVEILL